MAVSFQKNDGGGLVNCIRIDRDEERVKNTTLHKSTKINESCMHGRQGIQVNSSIPVNCNDR